MMCSAFDDVQMTSDSAFNARRAVDVGDDDVIGMQRLHRGEIGCGHESASEQPALRSGRSTFFCGLRIFAVSAMKWTPAKTMMSASVAAACLASPSESPM
jgi:hypothetical protein